MEAKELVRKCIETDLATMHISMSGNATFKVVGYNADMNCAIVDAYHWGWKILEPDDIIIEKCETYWYVRPMEITKVL